ncbi:MAG: hypothetical protein R3Y57_04880 [Erysipelotrichaceae bacterium]
MKKMISLIVILIFVFTLSGCGANYSDTDIKIIIPAGSKGEFIYSDEPISTNKDSITLSSDDEFLDTEIILKTIEVKEENAYEPTTFVSETPVDIDIEKNAWFKIGIAIQNDTAEDIIVHVNASDVIVRIE